MIVQDVDACLGMLHCTIGAPVCVVRRCAGCRQNARVFWLSEDRPQKSS